MAETSRSRVTITLGRSGQVVKRAGPVSDSVLPDSQPAVGSKRSIRDRLGSNVDATQLNSKRQRGNSNKFSLSAANGVDDTRLGKDDLRFKIMRKNVIKRTQSNGQPNGLDLRQTLSRAARPSTTSPSTGQYMPEPNDDRQRGPGPKYAGHRVPEPNIARHHIPGPRDASILGRIPSTRSPDALPQMDSLRNSFSPWTLDRLRRRSPDPVLGTSRGLSPQRNGDELQRRSLIRTYDDVRTVSYMSKDHELSRPMGSASFMTKPALPAGPAKPVAPLLAPLPPAGGIVQKSSYIVDEQLTVDSLLHSLGLEKYAICFKAEEVDMTALRQMGDNDLKELGIPMGPRKKILLFLLSRSERQAC